MPPSLTLTLFFSLSLFLSTSLSQVLIDFGLSKHFDREDRLTHRGNTPALPCPASAGRTLLSLSSTCPLLYLSSPLLYLSSPVPVLPCPLPVLFCLILS